MVFRKLFLAVSAALLLSALAPAAPQAANVSEWSTSASSNNATPPNGWPEGMAPSAVNDAAREMMAALARWYKDTNGSLVLGGTGSAYTLTTNSTHTVLADQSLIVAEVNTDSTGAATLAVDGLAAKDIVLPSGAAIAEGTLKAGAIAVFAWESDADDYILIAGFGGSAAALDAGTASGEVPVLGAAGLDSAVHGSAVPVGTVMDYMGATAPTGWLILNGDSICPAAGTCDQASDAYEDLYTLLWNSISNDNAPVAGGRGASAAADWAANKALTLPDARGRGTIGSGSGTDLTARTHGATGGEEEHTLTQAELPAARLFTATTDELSESAATANVGAGEQTARENAPANAHGYQLKGSATEATVGRTSPMGSGQAHNNMAPWLALTKIVRY